VKTDWPVRRVAAESAERVIATALRAVGVPRQYSDITGKVLVESDLRGVFTHGIALLPWYLRMLANRSIDPKARPVVAHRRGAISIIDARNALGPIGATAGMNRAIKQAAKHGVGFAAVRGSNHCAGMAAYASMALDHLMIGIAGTNALPTMAPPGGRERLVGANPVAVAIPASDGYPYVLDTSFAAAARGRITLAARRREEIPPGWARTASGEPTTDPDEALTGLLEPAGGAKGIGLALVVGILSTALTGAAYGPDLGTLETGAKPGSDGHFFMAIGVANVTAASDFVARTSAVLAQLRSSARANGSEGVRVPGDRAQAAREDAMSNGIPYPVDVLDEVTSALLDLGLTEPDFG
jgi:LDH2 family malate/lactate/ureidoglycolate dehydrogenase